MAHLIKPNKIRGLMHAIAQCEGFFVPNSLPARLNNPGDLEIGDVGSGTVDGKTRFTFLNDGWDYLFEQCYLILAGTSTQYTLDMTFEQFTLKYGGGDPNYASNLCRILATSTTTTLRDWVNDIDKPSATRVV